MVQRHFDSNSAVVDVITKDSGFTSITTTLRNVSLIEINNETDTITVHQVIDGEEKRPAQYALSHIKMMNIVDKSTEEKFCWTPELGSIFPVSKCDPANMLEECMTGAYKRRLDTIDESEHVVKGRFMTKEEKEILDELSTRKNLLEEYKLVDMCSGIPTDVIVFFNNAKDNDYVVFHNVLSLQGAAFNLEIIRESSSILIPHTSIDKVYVINSHLKRFGIFKQKTEKLKIAFNDSFEFYNVVKEPCVFSDVHWDASIGSVVITEDINISAFSYNLEEPELTTGSVYARLRETVWSLFDGEEASMWEIRKARIPNIDLTSYFDNPEWKAVNMSLVVSMEDFSSTVDTALDTSKVSYFISVDFMHKNGDILTREIPMITTDSRLKNINRVDVHLKNMRERIVMIEKLVI